MKLKSKSTNYLIKLSLISLVLAVSISCNTKEIDKEMILQKELNMVQVVPVPYNKAIRNPLKGFTTRGIYNQKWATLAQTYIKWNEIENDESDDIEKIRLFTDELWGDIASRNIKVIPRVYLHYSNDEEKYWPADMVADDYSSEQFQKRVVRMIERLGILWDNDPRVAFVELGIFGKWGEQEQPFATLDVQKLVADQVAKSFKNKLVSVRRNWEIFTSQPFGEYWDSWAHYDQMWSHGNNIAKLNNIEKRYIENYVGGEVAYDWGNDDIQPGSTPTESVSKEQHRNFIINSIHWLHCTQLRWIENYDTSNTEARYGADLIQQAFGYRYVIEKVEFNPSIEDDSLKVVLNVKNVGSAPFYYNWPLEVSLLDPKDHTVVWKKEFRNVNIKNWLPGTNWTAPEWRFDKESNQYKPNPNWSDTETGWEIPPKTYREEESFQVILPQGKYILALAILDPAGKLPSVRFATSQYFNGGRHPIGFVTVNQKNTDPFFKNMAFDDIATDSSLHYQLKN